MDQLEKTFNHILETKTSIDSSFKSILETWKEKLKKIKEKKKYCFLGESRVGKSTCINHLLETDFLLPTSADIACTSSVIVIGYKEQYLLSIDIMNETELTELVDNTWEELLEYPKDSPEYKAAEGTLKALYGIKKIQKSTPRPPIPEELMNVAKKGILTTSSTSRNEIKSFLKKYTAPSTSVNIQYWPLIKLVKLLGPFKILKEYDMEFIDLPGLHDANEAREKITRKYLEEASCICLVSRVEQIESSPVVRTIFKEQVIGKGIPTMVIASKLDSVHCKDVRQNNKSVIKKTDDNTEVISYQKRRVNMILESILREELDESDSRTLYQSENLISVPYFGISFIPGKVPKYVSDFDNLKNWFGNNSLNTFIDFYKLIDLMETFLGSKSIVTTNLSDREKKLKRAEEAINFSKKYFEDRVDFSFGDLDDKMEVSIAHTEEEIKSWQKIHAQTFMAALRRSGIFGSFHLDHNLMREFRDELTENLSDYFGFGDVISKFSTTLNEICEEIKTLDIIKELNETGESLLSQFKDTCKKNQEDFRRTFLSRIDDKFAFYSAPIYARSIMETIRGTGVRSRLIQFLLKELFEDKAFQDKYQETLAYTFDCLHLLFEVSVIDPMIQMFDQAKQMNLFGSRSPNLEKKHQHEMKFISKSLALVKDFENDQTEEFNQELDLYTAMILINEGDSDFPEEDKEVGANFYTFNPTPVIPPTTLVKLENNQRICSCCRKISTTLVNFEGSIKDPMKLCPECNEILKKK
jgi:GTP-binding protein EngB required for normal cell division